MNPRSPVLADINDLPYCKAFANEVMRWRPVAPAGVPHLSTKDEVTEHPHMCITRQIDGRSTQDL